ncbi:hypothetical protein J7M00_09045 [bacterium]|nr:hypothetical protein [bacterium]
MKDFNRKKLEQAEKEAFKDLNDEKLIKMIGSLGGKPTKKDRMLNIIFLVVVIALFISEIFWRQFIGTIALDVAVLLISLKLIYLMHSQARVNHYQFWILTAIEMKTTIMMEQLQKFSEKIGEVQNEN